MSTRDVLRAAKPKIHKIDTEHGDLYVRGLTGAGRALYLGLVNDAGNEGVPMHRTAALGLVEADGTPAYDIENEDHMRELAQVDGNLLQTICMKLFEVSGLSKKATEDAEKKSEASPS